MQNLLVLVIDGLQPAWLGPYGNTWIPTPSWNQLAAQSWLLDRSWHDAADLTAIYRAWWSGQPSWANSKQTDLAALLVQSGRQTTLITDDRSSTVLSGAEGWDEQIVIPVSNYGELMEDWTETTLAKFFAQATQTLLAQRPGFATWLHCSSLGQIWDAPLELRNQFVEADDPPALLKALPPTGRVAPHTDPDELLSWRQAAAAQTVLLDDCLGTFLAAWGESPLAANTWLVVLSGRGYPLAEHAQWGWSEPLLARETLHSVAMIRPPDQQFALRRSPWLAQPADLRNTLATMLDLPALRTSWGCDWTTAGIGTVPATWHNRIIATTQQRIGLLTNQWWYTQPVNANQPSLDQCELYLQPDDYFGINNVATRCQAQVEAAAQVIADWQAAVHTGNLAAYCASPLPEVLTHFAWS